MTTGDSGNSAGELSDGNQPVDQEHVTPATRPGSTWGSRWFGRRRSGSEPSTKRGSMALMLTSIVGPVVGLALIVLYAFRLSDGWRIASQGALIGAASLTAGGLLGLLFGLPRTLNADTAADEGARKTLSAIAANTNLEQISDWLTKILVGVGLTQIASIGDHARQLFHALSPSLGGQPTGAVMAGSIVIYYLALGFLLGWFYARLRLGLAMSAVDTLLDVSWRAARAGDEDTATAAKEIAHDAIKGLGT